MKALWALIFACFSWAGACQAGGTGLDVQPGDPFPDISFEGLVVPEDYAVLGLPQRSGPFRLSDVPGDLLILEFFNRYCLTCWALHRQLFLNLRSRKTSKPALVSSATKCGPYRVYISLPTFRRQS